MSGAVIRRSVLVSLILGTTLLGRVEVSFAQDSPIYIRSIQFERENVFPDSAAEHSGLKRAANRLHVVTREEVFRRELAFTEGDTLDTELVEDAERQLRGMSFVYHADSRIEVTGDSADIYFTTQDAWTLAPGYIIQSGGGLTHYGLSLSEDNLLGKGKMVYGEVTWQTDLTGPSWLFSFDDPQVFGSQFYLTGAYSTGPLGYGWGVSTGKPFLSPDDTWSYGGGVYSADVEERLFNNGIEVSRVGQQSSGFSVDATRAFGKRFKKKKVGFYYDYYELLFSDLGAGITNSPLPDDEIAHTIAVSGSIERTTYAETERINKFGRTEDIKSGRKTSVRLGRSLPASKGVDRWTINASHRERFMIGGHNFVQANVTFSTLFDRDTILSIDGRWYFNKVSWVTLAFNTQFDYAWDLLETNQFLLGADNGLRGYRARQFNGDKRFVANAEARFFLPVQILTLGIGAVGFVDTGTAWQRTRPVDFSELNYSTGVGLRLHYTQMAGGPVFRADIGWPIGQAGGPQLSLGFGQYF